MSPEDIDIYETEAVHKALLGYSYTIGNQTEEDIERLVSAIQNAPAGRHLLELLRALDVIGGSGSNVQVHPDSTTLGCMIDQLQCARRALEAQEEIDAKVRHERDVLEMRVERLCDLVDAGIGAIHVDEHLEIHDLRMCTLDVRAEMEGRQT